MKDVVIDEMSLSFHCGKVLPDVEKLILIKADDNWIVGNMKSDISFYGGANDGSSFRWTEKQFCKYVDKWAYIGVEK